MYHNYLINKDSSRHDIEVTGYLLRSLGFDSIGDKYEAFKKIAEGNVPKKSKSQREIPLSERQKLKIFLLVYQTNRKKRCLNCLHNKYSNK